MSSVEDTIVSLMRLFPTTDGYELWTTTEVKTLEMEFQSMIQSLANLLDPSLMDITTDLLSKIRKSVADDRCFDIAGRLLVTKIIFGLLSETQHDIDDNVLAYTIISILVDAYNYSMTYVVAVNYLLKQGATNIKCLNGDTLLLADCSIDEDGITVRNIEIAIDEYTETFIKGRNFPVPPCPHDQKVSIWTIYHLGVIVFSALLDNEKV